MRTLTPRQREIAALAAKTNLGFKEIAYKLGISVGTVKNHMHAIYERLNIDGRIALILWFAQQPPETNA